MTTETELNLDVSAEEARALHRVVRAMHDGHCPSCGYLDAAEHFRHRAAEAAKWNHVCPVCNFRIDWQQSEAALHAFQPYLRRSLKVFERWRDGEDSAELVEVTTVCGTTRLRNARFVPDATGGHLEWSGQKWKPVRGD